MANQPQWQDEDLDDILALLEKDYTQPQASAQQLPPPREEVKQPQTKEKKPEATTLREEYIPAQPRYNGIGDKPDFDETPAKQQKHWLVIPLSVVAVLEVAAIVAVVIWWQQWIL